MTMKDRVIGLLEGLSKEQLRAIHAKNVGRYRGIERNSDYKGGIQTKAGTLLKGGKHIGALTQPGTLLRSRIAQKLRTMKSKGDVEGKVNYDGKKVGIGSWQIYKKGMKK